VGAAVCASKSATKGMLLLIVRGLTSSVTVVTLADASALIGNNNSLVNNHQQKSLNSFNQERILGYQGTNHFSNLSSQLTVEREIFSGSTRLSPIPLAMITASLVDLTLLNIYHRGFRMNFLMKQIMTLKSFSEDSNKDSKKGIIHLKMT
jgi:hypothetical protein